MRPFLRPVGALGFASRASSSMTRSWPSSPPRGRTCGPIQHPGQRPLSVSARSPLGCGEHRSLTPRMAGRRIEDLGARSTLAALGALTGESSHGATIALHPRSRRQRVRGGCGCCRRRSGASTRTRSRSSAFDLAHELLPMGRCAHRGATGCCRASRWTGLGARPGTVLARALGRARPLDPPARGGQLRRGDRRGAAAGTGHPGDGHTGAGMPRARTSATSTRPPWTSAPSRPTRRTLVVPNAGEVLFRLR